MCVCVCVCGWGGGGGRGASDELVCSVYFQCSPCLLTCRKQTPETGETIPHTVDNSRRQRTSPGTLDPTDTLGHSIPNVKRRRNESDS